tara:strand:- start:1408 stop:1668 length:261 start_codon:yes stop_codon:yes gene_type:complete
MRKQKICETCPNSLIRLVFDGVVSGPSGTKLCHIDKIACVGMYPCYAAALAAWKGASHSKVDDAYYKYVIVHLHKMLEPDLEEEKA